MSVSGPDAPRLLTPLPRPPFLAHSAAMPDITPTIDTFLAPLARLAARFPDVEGAVVWGDDTGWDIQDDTTELLDAEEITFYAEGMLVEGFGMIWQAVADHLTPKEPDHILLFFWQGPAPAPPPEPGAGWLILTEDRRDPTGAPAGSP